MAFFELSKTERKRLSLFLICLGIAILSWLFFSLSGRYTYIIRAKVHYQNSPSELVFHPVQSDTLTLKVEGTGWQVLFSKLNSKISFININAERLRHTNFIALARQLDSINKYLGAGQRLISVNPDTLYFDFRKHNFKKVPVQLIHNIKFKQQYGVSGKILFFPDSVSVTGPVELIKKINSWKTDSLKLADVNTAIDTNLTIRYPSSKINVFPGVIRVHIPVGEFTEKSVELPVKVLNNKQHDVKLLPEKVSVTFLVGLNQYHKVNGETFTAVVDINKWIGKQYPQLPVQLKGFPETCKLIRIEPQVVDFMINK